MFPVLDPSALRAAPQAEHNSSSTGSLLLSIVALGAAQKAIGHPANIQSRATAYLQVLATRIAPARLDGVDIEAVMARFHFFVAFTAVGEKPRAWTYLQEAISLVLASIGGHWRVLKRSRRRTGSTPPCEWYPSPCSPLVLGRREIPGTR